LKLSPAGLLNGTPTEPVSAHFTLEVEGGDGRSATKSFTLAISPDPFAALKGTYNGLIYQEGGVTHESSGSFTVTVTDKGAFSAKLQVGGAPVTASGQLDSQGEAVKPLTRPGRSPLILTLSFKGADSVSGSLAGDNGSARLEGDRAVFDGKTRNAPQVGQYTVVFPGNTAIATRPAGDGFGTVTVDKAGRVKFAGTLADGTKVTQSATLSKDGHWPLYAPLYAGKGCLLAWIEFATRAASDLAGDFTWIKPAASTAKNYPAGFVLESAAEGSRYTSPAQGARILSIAEGEVVFSGGDLAEPLVIPFLLDAGNKVTAPGNSSLKLAFTPATGAFTGSVPVPGTQKPAAFSGVVLQKANTARGFSAGAQRSSQVVIRPR
jgi:hypothetical protein